MEEFIKFLGNRVFHKPDNDFYDAHTIQHAFQLCLKDVNFHFPSVSAEDLMHRITTNQNELAIFLFRLGSTIYGTNPKSASLHAIHFLMKDLCACEIYYSNEIAEGFYIFHGTGTVIGSRNKIGKGFKIYQNCTIGHRNKSAAGNTIGDHVVCYSGAKILGENNIGDHAVVGANTVVTKNIPAHHIALGNPMKIKEKKADSNIL